MKKSLKVILPVIVLLLLIAAAFASAKKGVVGEGEVGVTRGVGGTFTLYGPGKVPYAIPFIQDYHTVSTRPEVVSFMDEQAVRLESPDGKAIYVESQVTYNIVDVQKAVKEFGSEDIHQKIRNEIQNVLDSVVKEAIPDIRMIDSDTERPLITATIHLNLNDLMKEKGVSVSGYQIRYK